METISPNSYIQQYIEGTDLEFRWQVTPIQIYPLADISKHLKTPTPLLKADYNFLVFLEDGAFEHQVGIETHQVTCPALLFVSEGDVFSFISKAGALSGYFVLIESRVLHSVLGEIDWANLVEIGAVTNLEAGDSHWFRNLCQLLHAEITSPKPTRKVALALLQALFQKLMTLNDGRKTNSRQDEVANTFKQLLNRHYKEHKSVAHYAHAMNVSSNYLNRCVKGHFNKSCKQFIQEVAIRNSQVLMFETNMDIGEISMEVGFPDPSYFSRVFKHVTGQSPSAFRKRIMHGLS